MFDKVGRFVGTLAKKLFGNTVKLVNHYGFGFRLYLPNLSKLEWEMGSTVALKIH